MNRSTWFLVFIPFVLCHISEKSRDCCMYSSDLTNNFCPSNNSCSIRRNSNSLIDEKQVSKNYIYPENDQCQIISDSKKIQSDVEECFNADFTNSVVGTGSKPEIVNRVMVKAYKLNDDTFGQTAEIFGLEVLIPYSGFGKDDKAWKTARFRLSNNQGCDEHCSPRCVTIQRQGSEETEMESNTTDYFPLPVPSPDYLVYDCELGVYHQPNLITRITSGSTYGLDICLDSTCQSFLLSMPNNSEEESHRILIETQPLTQDGHLIMHFPGSNYDWANVSIRIESLNDPDDTFNMEEALEVGEDGIYSGSFNLNLSPSTPYGVLISRDEGKSWITVAQFHTGTRDNTAVGVVLSLFFIFSLLVGAFFVWKRYNLVLEKNEVNPTRLLDSGRIRPRNVLIISNVDNRHHIDIVLAFSKYLKAHCAVGEVYFALDPHTGITSQADHDPWKWAQETAEKISKENGFLLFLAGPPSEMGLAIYKDLPNNQAFVSVAYLQAMAEENRIAVLHFPYSDSETVPKILPQHIRTSPYLIPRETNAFLCQLLEVKMRELFPCIPYPMVKPRVLPHDMKFYRGGTELLNRIESMAAKVNLFRAEQKLAQSNGGIGTMTRTEDSLLPHSAAPSEVKGLLTGTKNIIKEKLPTSLVKKSQAPLKPPPPGLESGSDDVVTVTIEEGVYSSNNSVFEHRDKTVNPDVMD